MSKKYLIGTGLLLSILILGAGFFVVKQDKSDNSTASSKSESSNIDTAIPESKNSGQYIDYSAEALNSSNGTTILFFHAPWCPQCRSLDSDIKKSGTPEGVTIFKVDYDSNQDLRKKHGVTLQTTTVLVDARGNTIKKYVPYDNPTLENVKQNLL